MSLEEGGDMSQHHYYYITQNDITVYSNPQKIRVKN